MRAAVAVVCSAALALAGCAGGDGSSSVPSSTGTPSGVTAPPAPGDSSATSLDATATSTSTSTSTSTPPSTSTSSPPSAPTSATTIPAATAAPAPTAVPTSFGDVNQTINDPDLKESITVKRIARQLPWPEGYKASAQAYELVALEMTWTPSTAYTIPIRRQDFAVNSGSQFPNPPDPLVNDTIKAAGWALLPDQVSTGDPVTGWLVFKVDPRSAPKLVLDYTRPAAKVTGTSTSFPAKTFSVGLVG